MTKKEQVLEEALRMAAEKLLENDASFACTEMKCSHYDNMLPAKESTCQYSECIKSNVAHFKSLAQRKVG